MFYHLSPWAKYPLAHDQGVYAGPHDEYNVEAERPQEELEEHQVPLRDTLPRPLLFVSTYKGIRRKRMTITMTLGTSGSFVESDNVTAT
jgi:hypothetical protein